MSQNFRNKLMCIGLLIGCIFNSYADQAKSAAADFTLKSQSGENLRLQEMRGEVVLINFWASWCGPCRQEMPYLEKIQQKYHDLGFTVLGINVEEDSTAAKALLKELSVSFPILFDDKNTVSEMYKVDAMPMTVLVDRDGYQRYLHRGYQSGDEVKYQKIIKALLRE
ncbi:TlpA family protein disulfide reductase [Pseudoalteromonas denitrificans]|uniref:Thiol-disulfide isomerase or thioredoxin n=1 Tax=Pseudoalteromonas denitrificans DSM 6059 TaxID=1123010 RepID=A0A1I1SMW2_9GAMM|nr:TlpA disulfide reductase family protein [Pseudoalteromonas denitrificans]SFD47796.1 Thiol-disulfide isomerase or thioredoxin [Pseudoalteromonas denitrificans DSM 6059]